MKNSQRKYYRIVSLVVAFFLVACVSTSSLDGKPVESTNSNKEEQSKRSQIRMQLAIGYYQQGQYKVALEEIKQALSTSPDLIDAYGMRALIFMELGDKQLAEDNFLYALKLAPNNSDIANNYGWFLCQNGREKQAMPYFEKAYKDPAYPSPAKALNNAGVCSLKMKDNASAEKYFMLGFKQDPGSPSVNVNLSKIYYDRSEYQKAQFYIDRVLKAEVFAADVYWLAIKIEHKLEDQAAVAALGTQLRRRFPDSPESSLFQRGAFNE